MRYLVGLSDRAMNMAQPVEQGESSINKMFKGRGMGRKRRRWGEKEKEEEGIVRRYEGRVYEGRGRGGRVCEEWEEEEG